MSFIHQTPGDDRNTNRSQLFESSSPDPLQSSPTSINVRRSSPIRQHIAQSKPSSSRSVRLHDLTIASPAKQGPSQQRSPPKSRIVPFISTQNLPEGTSPWRIRVTVEAEPESGSEEDAGTIYNAREGRTVKVPLRGGADEEEEMEEISNSRAAPRGRGRNAAMTSPVKGGKRNATPARGRGISRRQRKSLTDLDATVLGDDSDDPDARPRRRSKAKRSPKKQQEKEQDRAQGASDNNEIGDEEVSVGVKVGRTRRASGARTFAIAEDPDAVSTGNVEDVFVDDQSLNLRRIDPNRVSVRARDHKVATHLSENSSRGREYPTPVSSPNSKGRAQEKLRIPDPTDEHDEFDSILESEGFTMISLDSIPSARQALSSPAENEDGELAGPSSSRNAQLPLRNVLSVDNTANDNSPLPLGLRKSSKAPTLYLNDDSEISSTMPSSAMPSSPPRQLEVPVDTHIQYPNLRGPTPQPSPQSSPKLPSPPRAELYKPAIDVEEKPTPPRLARVIRAGMALQGMLSPNRSRNLQLPLSPSQSRQGSPQIQAERSFNGYDVGTQRELRAGFRLGEELARQRIRSSSPATTSMPAARNSAQPPRTPTREPHRAADPTTLMVQRERDWQHEREMVSKQIEFANTSEVIVIESEDEEDPASQEGAENNDHDHMSEDEDEEDIWLQEAHESSQHSEVPLPKPRNVEAEAEPRRKNIPSPWKRGEGIDQSTFVSQADMSGLFWQTEKKQPSALHIPESKTPEKDFDLAKLLGVRSSPQKISFTPMASRKKEELAEDDVSESEITTDAAPEAVVSDVGDPDPVYDESEVIEEDSAVAGGDNLISQEQPSFYPESNNETRNTMDDATEMTLQTEPESSTIPIVKIPVNFGDESSTSKEVTPEPIEVNESRNSTTDETSSVADDSSTLPHAFGPSQAGWMGRLGSIASSLTRSREELVAADATNTSRVRPLEATEDDGYKPARTVIPTREDLRATSSSPVSQVSTHSSTSHRQKSSSTKSSSKSTATPLPTSGLFTKDHYRRLHGIYLKSLRRKVPKYAVEDLRPGLKLLLDQTAMSGSGSHKLQVVMGAPELAVVEEFYRELEKGSRSRVEWTEDDLSMRLYSIIAGYEVRGERPAV